jgi:radical SAM protein (TIGR01212 family)
MHSSKPYHTFQDFLSRYFEGKVQKIALHAGFTCPNRDGSIGVGGCTYCNNQTFNPDYCHSPASVTEQLKKGMRFFSGKYPQMEYLAYFQAYTNTYGEVQAVEALYEEALRVPGVRGLVIGTRPDCLPEGMLDLLERLSKRTFVLVELGMESSLDRTLAFIHRGHTQACTEAAVHRLAERGIPVGLHLILGLPGESREDILHHADVIGSLPVDTVKLHQLQLIRGTQMAAQAMADPQLVQLPTADAYAELVADFLERLRPDIAVERFVSQSPAELLIAPNWGLKNYEFTHKVERILRQRHSVQGCRYLPQQG